MSGVHHRQRSRFVATYGPSLAETQRPSEGLSPMLAPEDVRPTKQRILFFEITEITNCQRPSVDSPR